MHPKNENGQAMVEFALVLPILLLLLSGIIDFGWIFGNQLVLNNASREAARYTAIHYYESSTDDDESVAAEIIADRAPTLVSPTVVLTESVSDDSITVNVTGSLKILTPIIAAMFTDGECPITAECTMSLE